MEKKPFPAWSWSVEQCLKEYNVKLDKGLSSYQVEKQREKYGWNELSKEKGKPLLRLVLEQFDDMLVKILLVAAYISFILAYMHGSESEESGFEAYVEPFVIVLILVLNAIVGVWQETNAEKALDALKEMQCESGKVLRDGYIVPDLPARELVPGDIVELQVGDKVPADMRIAALKTSTLRLEQSALTGEAMPVLKGTSPIFPEECELQAKENMVFAGTTVVNGSCVCIVVCTGMNTEIGKIQKQIHEVSLEESDTPLKKKLDEFGSRLTTAIGLVCLIVWLINCKNFLSWDMVDGWPANLRFSFEKCTYYFKIAVALAVAAIPEGLPAVITTSLALGTKKMAQKNAIVRKLPSVETLGCTTVICSDKTGTLTTNQMSVAEFFTLGGKTTTSRIFHVEGTTYDPKDGGIVDWTCYNMDANLQVMAEICAVCNDAGIFCDGRLFRATGLPTEAALKVLVEKMGVPDAKMRNEIHDSQLAANYLIDRSTIKLGCWEWRTKRSKRLATLELDTLRKSMSVIVREPTGHNRLLVKVAKEASDMVLADDNFSTIVSAVAEGRSIYNNMKAFIRYMISSNVGEVISIFLTAALGLPECMIPVQLLWVNLVTDGPPATALGFNPPDVGIMRKPPRKSDDTLIDSWVLFRYLTIGSYVGVATVGIFILWYTQASFMGINLVSDGHTLIELSQLRNWGECSTWSNFSVAPYTVGDGHLITFSNPCDYFTIGKVKAMTLSLSVLVAIEMFNSLNALSEDSSLLTLPPWRNPWLLVAMSVSFGLHCLVLYVPFLANMFGVVPLSLNEWFLVILVSIPVILIDETLKFFGRSRRHRVKEKTA
ncbi:hypothetical protein ES288_A07G158600v1 [Gossypium darwinii]|uniref:P-type Ca(2+) transporter n=1 Tax=Gossypium darwinii TaxID=34276 RepID=A0A5D2FWT8_GOSDA|nr:hypothetical protein ES288_A07G158600v1 [Gossypium darwinii]